VNAESSLRFPQGIAVIKFLPRLFRSLLKYRESN
jgi:hypothetical protein